MTVQAIPRPLSAIALPAVTFGARFRDIVETVVFYGLIAAGVGIPIGMTLFATITR